MYFLAMEITNRRFADHFGLHLVSQTHIFAKVLDQINEFFGSIRNLVRASFQITFDLFHLHALAFDFHLILFVQIKVVKVSGNGFKLGVDLGQEILENLEFQTAF